MSIETKILRELEKAPRSQRELKKKLGNDRKVTAALASLLARDKIARKGERYQLAGRKQRGILCQLVKLGGRFGFAQPLDGSGDIFIPGRCLLGAMPGDEIEVELFEHPRLPGSREGEVVAITAPRDEFVGTVERTESGRLAVVPSDAPQTPILLRRSCADQVQPGDKAAIRLVRRGDHHDEHRAEVARNFGTAQLAKNCAQGVLYAHQIQKPFPEEVCREAEALEGFAIPAEELEKRMDLRDWPIFTIDSASTKDIDDAISLSATENGWLLGVHIADVSWFVTPHSELDKEALRRGTSVYYADQVVPMLPKQLSNGVCSLNPDEDRLAFSCLMELDRQGGLQGYRFAKTVIRSRVKGVYAELNALLEGSQDAALAEKYAQVADQLPDMIALYKLLEKRRESRGGMEIESGEAKLKLDENGCCVDVVKAVRGQTEEMIESFMLQANTCAALEGRSRGLPFVYRVHTAPESDRVDSLKKLLHAVGLNCRFAGEIPTPLELSRLLDETRNTPLERPVHTAVLRTMSKAKYESLPKGHFSLALTDYAHFTSPIRRYPDLAIHRILSQALAGQEADSLQKRFGNFAQTASLQSSQREVAAMQAEREIEACYKAEYMKPRVGQVFAGVVSGVAPHGLYVQLPNTVEGMIRAENLAKGPLNLIEGVALSDPLTGRLWQLGSEVQVKCTGVSVPAGNVDFELA